MKKQTATIMAAVTLAALSFIAMPATDANAAGTAPDSVVSGR